MSYTVKTFIIPSKTRVLFILARLWHFSPWPIALVRNDSTVFDLVNALASIPACRPLNLTSKAMPHGTYIYSRFQLWKWRYNPLTPPGDRTFWWLWTFVRKLSPLLHSGRGLDSGSFSFVTTHVLSYWPPTCLIILTLAVVFVLLLLLILKQAAVKSSGSSNNSRFSAPT